MTKKYGESLVETYSGDFAELEELALAQVASMKAETPDPLQEVLDDLVRDSEESPSRTTHEK